MSEFAHSERLAWASVLLSFSRMLRVSSVLGIGLFTTFPALAQPAATAVAAPASPAAPAAPPNAAPPAAPAPAPAATDARGAADATSPAPPPAGEPPPPVYYVEPPRSRPGEPLPPRERRIGVWEPPPPPVPRHVAPRSAFWIGARVGWFFPIGNILARGVEVERRVTRGGSTETLRLIEHRSVPWSDYADPGPMFEIDLGLRLSRRYNLFVLWERAELGGGESLSPSDGVSEAQRGDTDFWALGLRATTDPNDLGFLSEVALGYRRARSRWEDETELQLTDALLEARVGLGADIRINRGFSLSPLVTLGVGLFDDVRIVEDSGAWTNALTRYDEYDTHGWVTLQLGAHFDLPLDR